MSALGACITLAFKNVDPQYLRNILRHNRWIGRECVNLLHGRGYLDPLAYLISPEIHAARDLQGRVVTFPLLLELGEERDEARVLADAFKSLVALK